MKKGMFTKNLITSIVITVILLYFMMNSANPKIIFVPFLICSISMALKSLAGMFNKNKLEYIFGKIFTFGFLLFFIGFLVAACYIGIRDKNYNVLIFSIPFWIAGILLTKNKLFNRKKQKSEGSQLAVAIVISGLLVGIALIAGILLFVLGFKDGNNALILGGVIFTFGSLAFVIAALTIKGCFEKTKIDVLGLYMGAVIAVIGLGFIVLKYMETYSLVTMINNFGFWILVPILMIVVGMIQVIKCIKKK